MSSKSTEQTGADPNPSAKEDSARSLTSADFPVLWPVLTRWADNDMFGHLNNAVYYQLFDTAINGFIEVNTGTNPPTTAAQGIVAESGCRYFKELKFPDPLAVGLAVTRLGLGGAPVARPYPTIPIHTPAAGNIRGRNVFFDQWYWVARPTSIP